MNERDDLRRLIGDTGRGALATIKRDGHHLSDLDYLPADGVTTATSAAPSRVPDHGGGRPE
jgi:hypothetical protein